MIKQSYRIEDHGLIERLKQAPEIYAQETRSFMETVLAYILRLVKVFTPVGYTGLLRGNIFSEITGTPVSLQGKVATNSLYGEPAERGTKPHWTPIEPLKLWAMRVLGDAQAAYAVRWKIAKKGTRGAHMFKKAFDMSKSFVRQQQESLAASIARRIDRP